MMTPFLLARCSFLRWVIKKYIKLNSLILEMFLFSSYVKIEYNGFYFRFRFFRYYVLNSRCRDLVY